MRTVPEMLSGDPNSHHSSFLSLLTRPEEPPSSSSPLQVVSQDNKGFHSGWLQPIQSVHSTLQQQQYTVRSLGLDTMWNRSEIFHHLQSICIQNISIAIRDQRNTESWQLRAMEYQYDSKVRQEPGVTIDDDTGVSWWSLDITNESQPWLETTFVLMTCLRNVI